MNTDKIIIIADPSDTSLGALAVLLCLAGKQDMVSINPTEPLDYSKLARDKMIAMTDFNIAMINPKPIIEDRGVIPTKYKFKHKHKRRY